MTPAEARKKFERAIHQLSYIHSKWQAFQDFLDFTLIWMRCWDRKAEHFAALEKKYDPKKYTEHFVDAMFCLLSMSEGYQDPFGDYFMEHLSSNLKGQFFTPMDICDLMVMPLKIEDAAKGASVCDPTCGSGRTLLAAAKLNPECIFFASDIDIICCKMTVLNFILSGMEGEVAWMDALAMKHWKSWHIRRAEDDKGNKFMYYWETGAGETNFITRLKNTLNPANADQQEVEKKIEEAPLIMLTDENSIIRSPKKKHENEVVLFD